jgi:hypothetical protein
LTVTVKDDAGNPVPLGSAGLTMRTVATEIGFNFTATEANLNVAGEILDPAGNAAGLLATISCRRVNGLNTRTPDYHGNGVYRVNLRIYPQNVTNCAGTPSSSIALQYTIDARTSLAAASGPVLTRKPNDFAFIEYRIPIDLNPGASALSGHNVFFALNGQVAGPGQGLTTPGEQAFVDEASRSVPVRFRQPGSYTFVARVKGPAGDFFSPWSSPITVKALAPFDFDRTSFPDQRGPSYSLRHTIREKAATGPVTIAIARGRRGGKYRRLSGKAPRIRNGRITKRFRLRRTGTYRLRYTYKGNDLVAPGRIVQQIQIRRRFFG